MELPSQLISAIGRNVRRTASPAVQLLIDEILARYGKAVQGILFYGSCLRSGDDLDGLVDLYLLVDNYHSAFKSRWQAVLNSLLPPNVYYLERKFEDRAVRTKFAVLSLVDFKKGTSMDWFHSYLWGRFCQPTAVLYARDENVHELVVESFARAVLTFTRRVLPQLDDSFTAQQLWSRGLTMSYGAELRSEKPEKRARLFDVAPQYYEEITKLAAGALADQIEIDESSGTVIYSQNVSPSKRLLSRWAWKLRSWQGKLLSILRLVKATLTFEGGVDYIRWKIERHSGVTVDIESQLKHHRFLAICVLAWRLYRKGRVSLGQA